ncbi:MAG: 50S ribosome-binding GTPase [Phycisphaerae bacterium]|nr:50S ribosome-binding GTPase [Phycisphaerae bacterium]
MPANLTPEYMRADERYREAETPAQRLEALEEMLRAIPKHKGTDKMQADLKRKIAQARREVASPSKKASSSRRDLFNVPKQGAGQVVLLGAPNVGKSALVRSASNAECKVAEYPFTTQAPQPGMAHHEDVPIQLVDMPPVTREHVPPGMIGRVKASDALLIVASLASQTLLDDLETCLDVMANRNIAPTNNPTPEIPEDPDAPMPMRTLVACTYGDVENANEEFQTLKELYGDRLEFHCVAVPDGKEDGQGIKELVARLFELLHVVRVYAKPPGKPVDYDAPFILPKGSTAQDLATEIHREKGNQLKSTRVWGQAVHDGQNVHHDYVLNDKDAVELHM